MAERQSCSCGEAPTLIFACSGAADVGEVSDLAARRLTQDGAGKMYCLAGIGGRVSGIMATTEAAAVILTIDGCDLSCARRTLEQAGLTPTAHLTLGDFDMAKGATPPTEQNVQRVAARGAELLRAARLAS